MLTDISLAEAREKVQENRGDGLTCPCCDLFAKVYRRTITSTMARWLIELVNRYQVTPGWYSYNSGWSLKIMRGSGDIAKLLYWGLVERKAKDPADDSVKHSGLWRPSRAGISFVYGSLTVQKNALVYGGKCLGLEGDNISIRDALTSKFNYSELMRR